MHERIAANYARHRLTDYDVDVAGLRAQEEAISAIRCSVLDAIGTTLATES
ncbi:MAG: hypothetical protein J2P54_15275 [Bradyrhizobiaceae bacterium]|nr:hypothetical protein [Bradyrhizobiaceae bacterium]